MAEATKEPTVQELQQKLRDAEHREKAAEERAMSAESRAAFEQAPRGSFEVQTTTTKPVWRFRVSCLSAKPGEDVPPPQEFKVVDEAEAIRLFGLQETKDGKKQPRAKALDMSLYTFRAICLDDEREKRIKLKTQWSNLNSKRDAGLSMTADELQRMEKLEKEFAPQ